jgi:hypothetical protein
MFWTRTAHGHRKFRTGLLKSSSQGSVTMEYIVVSTFALLVSISAVTWIGKIIKDRVDKIASKMGAESNDFDLGIEPLQ